MTKAILVWLVEKIIGCIIKKKCSRASNGSPAGPVSPTETAEEMARHVDADKKLNGFPNLD